MWFGNYMQNSADTKDPVKWRVLHNADGKLLLLSDQNLDCKKYNEEYTSVTWETSTIRTWLNSDFQSAAFSTKEADAVVETEVVNAENPEHHTPGGNTTTDEVFLLSIGEAKNTAYGFTDSYSSTDTRVALNTEYAKAQGAYTYSNGAGEWWLRSPGDDVNYAAFVNASGDVDYYGYLVGSYSIAVRPAFNLNLESVLFTSAAEGGKSSGAEGALNEVGTTSGSEWKLTLKDTDRGFAVTGSKAAEDGVTVEYTGAESGDDEYISAVIKDNEGKIKYYGRLAKVSDAGTSGSVTINAAGKLEAGDTLYVFNEQYNGEKKTDYASALQEVTIPEPVTFYTVTFMDGQGKTLKTEKVESGKAATAPAAPKRSGYTFTGWDKDFSKVTADLTVTAKWKKNAEPAPATKVSGTLLSKMTAKGKTNLVLTWNKVKGAEGYDIFFIKCGKEAPKKIKTIKGNKTFKWTKSGLKKGKAYKAVVKAYVMKNGKKTYVRTSPTVHAYTSGGTKHYTNSKGVTVKKTSASLKVGKTYKIKASVTKLQKGKKLMPTDHALKLRYVSSNKNIATVSKFGKITAKSKGSCKVYVIAMNGARKAVTVTVK